MGKFQLSVCNYHHHHDQVAQAAQISMTLSLALSLQPSLSIIDLGRSSAQHPEFTQSRNCTINIIKTEKKKAEFKVLHNSKKISDIIFVYLTINSQTFSMIFYLWADYHRRYTFLMSIGVVKSTSHVMKQKKKKKNSHVRLCELIFLNHPSITIFEISH